jgi:Protein of unknown function (DUF3093)
VSDSPTSPTSHREATASEHRRAARPEERNERFDERLRVPWWWWPPALGVAGLLAAEVHLGYPGIRAWLPYLLLAPLATAALLALGRARIQVAGGELRVGHAHIPLHFIGDVEVISRAGKRRALGPELDPAAYLLHRGWVGPMLRVRLTDPDDPTPYWVFSTRHPERLAALLRVR